MLTRYEPTLAGVRSELLELTLGQELDIGVMGTVKLAEASSLARSINRDRGENGHIHIEVKPRIKNPVLATPIHVRCSR